jgi:GTP cyclohydrolase IA
MRITSQDRNRLNDELPARANVVRYPGLALTEAKPLTAAPGRMEALDAVTTLLQFVGEDPAREGLEKTPGRVARMLGELTTGYGTDPEALINGAIFSVDYDEMVVVKDIEFYSLCEHHMLPFMGHVHVAYIPDGKVIGLSKIPRIVEMFARRLQVQERMTVEIAEFIESAIGARGVAVVAEGLHLCSVMRGVKKAEARMVTQAMRGTFRSDPVLRAEFMGHVHGAGSRTAEF